MIRINLLGAQKGKNKRSGAASAAAVMEVGDVGSPKMKILVQSGYFDLACPYGTVKAAIDHLNITPELRKNVHLEFYEAGHMMYVHPESMRKFGETTKAFIDANSN